MTLAIAVYMLLLMVVNAVTTPSSSTNQSWIGLAVEALFWLVDMASTLARPAERWLTFLRNVDTPRTLLAIQQKVQAPHASASGLGPIPDLMNHLYRNPAGVRCMGTLVTTALVTRIALAASVPLLLLGLNAAVSSSIEQLSHCIGAKTPQRSNLAQQATN